MLLEFRLVVTLEVGDGRPSVNALDHDQRASYMRCNTYLIKIH